MSFFNAPNWRRHSSIFLVYSSPDIIISFPMRIGLSNANRYGYAINEVIQRQVLVRYRQRRFVYYRIYIMFLNLKSKRVENAIQNQLKTHNHPKTQRDQRPERSSKQQGERPNKKVPNVMIKKQTASTALTTMQAGSSYANVAHHYVIHRLDSTEKQSESIGKSVEKLDSQRSHRIANAYRKIKKNDISQRVVTEQPFEEAPRKSNNRTHYPLNKKQIVTNFANNYIAITQTDQQESRRDRNTQRQTTKYFSKVIQLLLQVFRNGKLKNSVAKFRSLSSKEIDLNDSLERSKRSNKNLKSKSKPLQANQSSKQSDQAQTSIDILERFKENLAKSQEKLDELTSQQWIQVSSLIKELYAEMGQFMKQLHGKFIVQMQEKYEQYEKGLEIVIMEQTHLQQHCKDLQSELMIERNRTSILAQSLQEMHNKTLYCSAFFNQLSFNFDLDSFLKQKIYEYAGENNSIINSRFHSTSSLALKKQFLQAEFGFQKQKKKS